MLVPQLVTRVTKLPYGVDPSYLGYQTHVVTTQVRPGVSGNSEIYIVPSTRRLPTKQLKRLCYAALYNQLPTFTQVLAHDLPVSASIPLWILILAILAGFLFLSLLTFILYKLGFFQRKRPEDYDYQGTIQVRSPLLQFK